MERLKVCLLGRGGARCGGVELGGPGQSLPPPLWSLWRGSHIPKGPWNGDVAPGNLTPRQSPLWFPGLGISVSEINTDTTSDPSPARHSHRIFIIYSSATRHNPGR